MQGNDPDTPSSTVTATNIYMRWRPHLWELMDDPGSSKAARAVSTVSLVTILVSVISVVLETDPYLSQYTSLWFIVELVCVSVFSLEYLLRLVSAEKTLRFILGPLNILDLVAILPFFVQVSGGHTPWAVDDPDAGEEESFSLSFVRVIRLVRVFKIFKGGVLSEMFGLLMDCVSMSMPALTALGFLMLLFTILFSAVMYQLEHHANGVQFPSILASAYWCITTFCAVGYGIPAPKSGWGMLVASITMLAGLIILALPITVIGSNFASLYEAWKNVQRRRKIDAKGGCTFDFMGCVGRMSELKLLIEQESNMTVLLELDPSKSVAWLTVASTCHSCDFANPVYSDLNPLDIELQLSSMRHQAPIDPTLEESGHVVVEDDVLDESTAVGFVIDDTTVNGSDDDSSAAMPVIGSKHSQPVLSSDARNPITAVISHPVCETTFQEDLLDPPSSIKKAKLWLSTLLEDPSSSLAAHIISIFLMAVILVSVVCFILETLPALECWSGWDEIELACVIVFTLEYGLRLLAAESRVQFVFNTLNLIDFFAIAPFYLSLILATSRSVSVEEAVNVTECPGDASNFAFLRIIRMVRVFRIFKFGKYSAGFTLFTETLRLSLPSLGILCSLLVMFTILFSSIMYYAETSYVPPNPQFVSIPVAFYWCVTTFTTVGYGDMYPKSPLGQVIASITMLCGLLIIALPMTVIITNFSGVYTKWSRKEQIQIAADNPQSDDDWNAMMQRFELLFEEFKLNPGVIVSLHTNKAETVAWLSLGRAPMCATCRALLEKKQRRERRSMAEQAGSPRRPTDMFRSIAQRISGNSPKARVVED